METPAEASAPKRYSFVETIVVGVPWCRNEEYESRLKVGLSAARKGRRRMEKKVEVFCRRDGVYIKNVKVLKPKNNER